MSDQIRVNKYRAYYTGPDRGDPGLRLRAQNDRTSLRMMRSHRSIDHVANMQTSAPRDYRLYTRRHNAPLHVVPEMRGATRYIRGSAKFNQAVERKIKELAQIIR
jgi:hypothetical protein